MKSNIIKLINHIIFLLPCWFLDIIGYLSKEFQHTPKSVYMVLAFEMVLTAFASGDKVALKKLLSTEVAANFIKVMKEREASGHDIADTLVGIKTSEMVEVYLEGSSANITVKFVSEQIKVTYDDDGNILEGSPKTVITVADFWTFSRDIKTKNPNWILIATRSLD